MLVVRLLKTKKELKNLCRQEIQILFTEMSLIKIYFQHYMAYGKSKDLARRTKSDKVLRHKAFEVASMMVIKQD